MTLRVGATRGDVQEAKQKLNRRNQELATHSDSHPFASRPSGLLPEVTLRACPIVSSENCHTFEFRSDNGRSLSRNVPYQIKIILGI